MSKKTNGVKHARTPLHKMRRVSALQRLEAQLVLGTKNAKVTNTDLKSGKSTTVETHVFLTDSDKKRIEREILTLKSRI